MLGLALYLGVGLLLIALAIPLIMQKVAPNPWYGFRVRQTLEHPDIWYAANLFAGKALFLVGLLTSLAALILYLVVSLTPTLYHWVCTGILLAGLAMTLVQSLRYVRRISHTR